MYYIEIYNRETATKWKETFFSYYFFRKRVIKINHSKKLIIISRSNLED